MTYISIEVSSEDNRISLERRLLSAFKESDFWPEEYNVQLFGREERGILIHDYDISRKKDLEQLYSSLKKLGIHASSFKRNVKDNYTISFIGENLDRIDEFINKEIKPITDLDVELIKRTSSLLKYKMKIPSKRTREEIEHKIARYVMSLEKKPLMMADLKPKLLLT